MVIDQTKIEHSIADSFDEYLMLIMILIYYDILIMANTLIASANHDNNYVST